MSCSSTLNRNSKCEGIEMGKYRYNAYQVGIDNDTRRAKMALHRKFTERGIPLKKIVFGKIRVDGTRGVKVETQDGKIASWSYLTDIV